MLKYIKRFFKGDDGAELIEVVIAIAIVAVIAGVVVGVLLPTLGGKINDANDEIKKINPSIMIP